MQTVSIDGAKVMVGIRNGVVELMKHVWPEIASIQRVINRDALEDKKLGNEEENYQLADVISDIIKIVNAILNRPKESWVWWTCHRNGRRWASSLSFWSVVDRLWKSNRECRICDRNFLCDLIDEEIIKLFSFTFVLACCLVILVTCSTSWNSTITTWWFWSPCRCSITSTCTVSG